MIAEYIKLMCELGFALIVTGFVVAMIVAAIILVKHIYKHQDNIL